jgi:hypothetical protein
MILNSDPGGAEDFSVFVARYTDKLGQNTMMDPHRQRFDNVNYYQFYMAGYIVYIKVDKRPAPKPQSVVCLKPDNRLCVVLRDFRNSKEARAASLILERNNW